MSWWRLQPPILIDHFASGDGDDRDTVALHALEDVVVHSLVVGLGWYLPTKTQRYNYITSKINKNVITSLSQHAFWIPSWKKEAAEYFTYCEILKHSFLIESGQYVLIHSIELLQITNFAATSNIMYYLQLFWRDSLLSIKAGVSCWKWMSSDEETQEWHLNNFSMAAIGFIGRHYLNFLSKSTHG